ncbi:MAG: hypothetical protein V1769_00035 [Thermoplasmatota archaeon]
MPAVPEKPTGPTQIEPGNVYTFSSSTTDPDSDSVYYLFDWGDNNLSGWIGPYGSGETAEASHSWAKKVDIAYEREPRMFMVDKVIGQNHWMSVNKKDAYYIVYLETSSRGSYLVPG